MFTFSTKREIRHFHVVFVQWQQRNVQKWREGTCKVSFGSLNLLRFCRSLIKKMDLTKIRRWRQKQRQKAMGLVSKTTTLHVHHAFLFISFRSLHNYDQILSFFLRTRTARRLILPSLSELGVAPSLQFQPKFPSLKGCGVYCSVTFSWTSPLVDRKVPNSLRRRQQRERQNSERFIKQTTSLQVHHAFLYISLPLLQEYDGKLPNFTFYGGRKQATTKFSFSS